MNFFYPSAPCEFKQWLPTSKNSNKVKSPDNDWKSWKPNEFSTPVKQKQPQLCFDPWNSPTFYNDFPKASAPFTGNQWEIFPSANKLELRKVWETPRDGNKHTSNYEVSPWIAASSYFGEFSTDEKSFQMTRKQQLCSLCRQNGERKEFYTSHNLKGKDGKVTCPVLREYVCEICGETGDNSHTRTHCPLFRGKTKSLALKFKKTHDSCGRMRK